jgi:hypothetical protein
MNWTIIDGNWNKMSEIEEMILRDGSVSLKDQFLVISDSNVEAIITYNVNASGDSQIERGDSLTPTELLVDNLKLDINLTSVEVNDVSIKLDESAKTIYINLIKKLI